MDQTSTQHNPRPNPYVGPRSFEKGQPIYGRDAETRALASLLSAERIVLLHAPSGAGKTSLIQAALVPAMEKRRFYIRPSARVNREPTKIPIAENYNRYIFSLLSSFESAFPTGEQISEEELASLTLVDYFKRRPRPEDYSFEMFIFDQFEEILTLHPADQNNKTAFFSQVGRMLADDTRWALFSMREDFLGALDPYLRYIPDGLSTRYRLDLLGKKAASQALQLPADDAGVTFEDKAVERLLNDLSMVLVQCPDGEMERQPGPHIEPVQLQVVAYRLWDSLAVDDSLIDNADLDKLGDVGKALGAYYAQIVNDVASMTGVSERNIREWFGNKLITEGAIRSQVRKGKTTSEGLPNEAVAKLEDAHLIRAEKRGEWTWYELAHDRLVQPVVEDNRSWFDNNLSLLQRQAELWNDQDRPESLLLSGKELNEANTWATNNQAVLQQHEKDFLSACEEVRQREKQAYRIRRLIVAMGIGAVILAIVAVIFAISADKANNLAQQAERIANTASTQAVSEQRNAQIASTRAVEQAGLAATAQVVAQNKAKEAKVSQLAAQALAYQGKQYDLALLLSVEAFRRQDSYQTRNGLFDTLQYGSRMLSYHSSQNGFYILGYSPDGSSLVDAPDGYPITLLDPNTFEPIGEPLQYGSGYNIDDVAFWPDSTKLAVLYPPDAVVVWDLSTHKQLEELPAEKDKEFFHIALSPDGKLLAVAYTTNQIDVLDTESYEPVEEIRFNEDLYFQSMIFSPDNKTLIIQESYGIVFWDYRNQVQVGEPISVENDSITSLAISPDGAILATGMNSDVIRLWDTTTHTEISDPLFGHTDLISSLAFSPDGQILGSASWDKTVILWDMNRRKPLGSPLRGHSGEVYNLVYAPDGNTLLSSGSDNYTIAWDMRNSLSFRKAQNIGNPVTNVAYSPDGEKVAFREIEGQITLLDTKTGKPIGDRISTDVQPDFSYGNNEKIAFSPDGKYLAAVDFRGIKLLDITTTPPMEYSLDGVPENAQVNGLAFSPDGKLLAAGDTTGDAIVWDVSTRQELEWSLFEEGEVKDVIFSPDGKYLLYGGDLGPIKRFDVSSQTEASDYTYRQTGVFQYSPDGSIFAYCDGDTIFLIDRNNDNQIGEPLVGEQDPVLSMSFSSDGNILAASYADNMIILWDVATGQRLGKPIRGSNSSDSINSVSFSPDGKTLASGDNEGFFILWDVDPNSWAEDACQMASRNLTEAEWARYVGSDEPYTKTCPRNP
jgi:WD40 repeat protein